MSVWVLLLDIQRYVGLAPCGPDVVQPGIEIAAKLHVKCQLYQSQQPSTNTDQFMVENMVLARKFWGPIQFRHKT